MVKRLLIILMIFQLWGVASLNAADTPRRLRVFQINIWQEGTQVEGGFDAITDEIIHSNADIVLLSEVRNYGETVFVNRLTEALLKKGCPYYCNSSTRLDVGILSKYPIQDQSEIYPDGKGSGSILRATMKVGNKNVAVYSAHLNYTDYACYLPRGYDGKTWKKLTSPITDPDSILAANRLSWREESIKVFLNYVKGDINRGCRVILGGDFNEPSHLDWMPQHKNLWDHNGASVKWDCSTLLYEGGFKDAYRIINPDVLKCPGFTFPADNIDVPISKLSWAPEADERDRIDFVYYYPCRKFRPVKAYIVGPSSSIVKGVRKEENTSDRFIEPQGIWPTDHKALLIEFSI